MDLHVFDGKTGAHRRRLQFEKVSWQDSINETGAISASVPGKLSEPVRPYADIIAAIDDGTVLHAGYVHHSKWDAKTGIWSIDGGGGATILERRLVINHALDAIWKDGQVLVDEDHPSGNWPLKLTGSYSDIISKLVRETLKFGALPIVPAAITGGDKERTYNSYDFAYVSDRIADLGDLAGGVEYRFDASIANGSISFSQLTSADGGELVTNEWRANLAIDDPGIVLVDVDMDGRDMCTQSYGSGGKDADMLMVARSVSGKLAGRGWPVLQSANKSHTSISVLSTLKGYLQADTACGDATQDVYRVSADMTRYPMRVGDWLDLRTVDGDVLALKVTDVSGSDSSQMLDVQCRERVGA